MRAAVVARYGGPEVVQVVELRPPRPRRGQVLVRVLAAGVSSGDARIRAARFPPGFAVPARLALGLRGPRRPILGITLSGTVEEVGVGVDDVRVGDQVCGMTGARMGAHAELVAISADRLVVKPAVVSHEEAAALLFGAMTAWHFLRGKASVGAGTSVLVNGASGAVGTSAVQLAAHLGATVTGVTSAVNAPLVRGLGASAVVDHAEQDLTDLSERFDVVLDTVGNISARSGRQLLRQDGVLVLAAAGLADTVRARGDVVAGPAPQRTGDMRTLLRMLGDGELRVVTESVHALEDIVAAYRRVDSGRKVGNIVIRP